MCSTALYLKGQAETPTKLIYTVLRCTKGAITIFNWLFVQND